MKRDGLMILAVLLVGTFAYAQAGLPPGPGHGPRGEFGPGGRGFGMWKVVTGAPYSADVGDQSIETLADGNTIQRSTTGHVARDSQGRTYVQQTITGGPLAQDGPKTVTFVSDPVAGYSYVLNANTKIAMRRAIKTPLAGASPPRPDAGMRRDSANRIETDLGTKTTPSGVTLQGKSVTHTIPAGAMGNAQPIVSTSETWYSPDLQIPVSATRSDPRSGKSTYNVSNIQRGEPPASLFQVPSDYTIQDAPAPRGGPRFHRPPQ